MPKARVAVMAILLVGCAAPATDFTAPSLPLPLPTVQATPALPTPAPGLSLVEQARLYLASEHSFNSRRCRFNRRWANSTNWTAMATAFNSLADSYRTRADRLHVIEWSDEIRKDVEKLVNNLAAQEAAMRAGAEAPDKPTFRKLNRFLYKLNVKGIGISNAVHIGLGIDSVAGDPCDAQALGRR